VKKGMGAGYPGISATGAAGGWRFSASLSSFFLAVLADFALRFGPASTCSVAVFALSIIAAVIKGATIKGLILRGSV